MEDGVNGSSNTTPPSQVPVKAGWLKKSSGILGLWKERYIQVLKTQLLVGESEDELKSLETLELCNYERCEDPRAFFKRKRTFTLIPSPGTKVQDIKFLARNAEERDTWIQALNEGINRGKNKIFDEVKVDSSNPLEHVTRDRAKVAATKRRPPTRIHLKEVAEASADDSLRLGLDTLKTEVFTVVPRIPQDAALEPQKKEEPVKIPRPPSKSSHPTPTETAQSYTVDSDSKVPRPPSPPPKILKESVYAREKLLSEAEEAKDEGKSELKTPISSNPENLEQAKNTPPKPPPKIISDKMKIKWLGSSTDLLEQEKMTLVDKGSKENLVEFEATDHSRSPSPIPKVESASMEASHRKHSTSNLDGDSPGVSSNQDNEHNMKEHSMESNEEQTTKDTEAGTKDQLEINDMQKSEIKENENRLGPSNGVSEVEKQNPKVEYTVPSISCTLAESKFTDKKAKSSSMGDLLSKVSMVCESENRSQASLLHLTKDHFFEMEMKLAVGRERTETLLNQVLQGQLVKSPENNGPEVNAETLLNEAVQQLREASQVLQEIKESSKLSNTPEAMSENQKEKQKELVTLYRRSAP
ncbi:pleckstrin homology domain-containing family O member 2 [Pelodytes ibericus]